MGYRTNSPPEKIEIEKLPILISIKNSYEKLISILGHFFASLLCTTNKMPNYISILLCSLCFVLIGFTYDSDLGSGIKNGIYLAAGIYAVYWFSRTIECWIEGE